MTCTLEVAPEERTAFAYLLLAEAGRLRSGTREHQEVAEGLQSLYDGFVADADKRLFARIRSSTPAGLAALAAELRDPRMPDLLFRYRARNWPDSLSPEERRQWDDYRRRRLGSDCGLSEYCFASYLETIAGLRGTRPEGADQALLDALESWGRMLEAELADAPETLPLF